MVRQCGRRQQRRRARTRLGTQAIHRHNTQVSTSSFNSTTSYMSEIRTPETIASVELSSRNFTVSFSEHAVIAGETTCDISSHNYTRSFALHRSRLEHQDSPFGSFNHRREKLEQPSELHHVNEISEIEHNSRANLHYQASSSQILEGPLNSSIVYPNNSTPRKTTTLETVKSDLSDCVKELVFDSDNSIGSPTETISSIRRVSPSGSRDTSISSSSTCRPASIGGESSLSPSSYTVTFSTYTTVSSSDTYSFPRSSRTQSSCDPSSFDFLSCTADSDATAFLEKPLNAQPVTYKSKDNKYRKSSKYRKMAKQLRSIGRQIQKGSKNLNLKTLAVI